MTIANEIYRRGIPEDKNIDIGFELVIDIHRWFRYRYNHYAKVSYYSNTSFCPSVEMLEKTIFNTYVEMQRKKLKLSVFRQNKDIIEQGAKKCIADFKALHKDIIAEVEFVG